MGLEEMFCKKKKRVKTLYVFKHFLFVFRYL